MPSSSPIPSEPERDLWDVIVVGAGMGGGAVGHELARMGRSVLFVERGQLLHGPHARAGWDKPPKSLREGLMRSGRWPDRLKGRASFGDLDFMGPMGCGTGGSTGLYSAQLERFRASDFAPRAWYPNAANANLPEAWPVDLAEMVPFYRRVEALFGVSGSPDPLEPDLEAPLRTPAPMSDRDRSLFESFEDLGLHPYRSHVGLADIPGCRDCDEICISGCKSDAGNRFVAPALKRYGARILPECEAVGFEADGRRVVGVVVDRSGERKTLKARMFVLAAGAWMTPALLLRSRSSEHPDGLANGSGMVGRNLMLHATDLVAVDPGEWRSSDGPRKGLTLNDFYDDEGFKLGSFQAVGRRLEAPIIESLLMAAADRDPVRWRRKTPGFAKRAARMAARDLRGATLMATIMEDLPYVENRVVLDGASPGGFRFEYRYPTELADRANRFRRRLTEVLSPRMRVHVVPLGDDNLNYGHVCGTCRFGEDPSSSVLDPSNRAHQLDNLYVVDASFFPSSGAINPSLTVAANGLRVGGLIHERL